MSLQYERPQASTDGLRLHLNENTGGCSPRVIEALNRLTVHDIAHYPDYDALSRDCARFLGVSESQLLLTNGLDEGILAAAIAYLQRGPRTTFPAATAATGAEAIVVEPAFGMYADCVEGTGGVMISIPFGPEFEFPLAQTLAAVTPQTRLVYLTNPGNPSGTLIPQDAVPAIAKALPPGAIVFLDECYADFTTEHFLDQLPHFPNVVVGRTFAKSYGLAGVRIGAVVGAPDVIKQLRRSLPPYSINVLAATVLSAALSDQAHVQWYRQQVEQSRALFYAACDRWGLHYWPSHTNFVLVRVGPQAPAIVEALAARGIFIRDRSNQPGCAGCIRITTGIVEHTQACLAALEEILCAKA
jgi:histidinol-phosphate aminotransferase